jgi:hypothetical protein
MRHRLVELNNRYGKPQALRLAYVVLALLALAAASGAPVAWPTGH